MTPKAAKKTATKAARKTAAKKAKAKMPPAPDVSAASDVTANLETTAASARPGIMSMVPALAIVLAVGIGIGVMLGGQNGSAPNRAEINEAIRSYIAANPDYIIETVNNHIQDRRNEEVNQSINLVRADDGVTVFGNPDGDVTIYEFSDYNCGYCKRVFGEVKQLVESDGNIRVVIKEFPILSEGSVIAARYAIAAGKLGLYEDFHVALMGWQGTIDQAAVDQVIADLGIDRSTLDEAADDDDIEAVITANRELAQALQLTGTPGFVIGDEIVPGAISKAELEELVATARENAANG